MNLSQLIKSTGKYDLSIFSAESADRIEKNIFEKNGERKLDEHGHLKQKHDLKEIADAFEKWAGENKLSFWK